MLNEPAIADQILDCFPAGTYALTGLLRLLDIVESRDIPTAAVECTQQPRLLVNPDFIVRHARTPETLLMLVMHELHHVLLGHTTLFPTATPAQNFVFDAVINGVISRMFPSPDYTCFLTDYYDDAVFPHCLLRPPPGWPQAPRAAAAVTALSEPLRSQVDGIHQSLYAEAGASYDELFKLLPELLQQADFSAVPLIGCHQDGGSSHGGLDARAPLLVEVVRSVVEQWPQPPDPIRGRSLADVCQLRKVQPCFGSSNRRRLRLLISKLAQGTKGGADLEAQAQRYVDGPLPNAARRSLVLRALGQQPLLHPTSLPFVRRGNGGERVHVYVDVSGSMQGVLEAIYGAVFDCRKLVHPQVHLFSTRVADISLAQLRTGLSHSTGGTDIRCVTDHMAVHQVRRALLITDGWVGVPAGQSKQVLQRALLGVAYAGQSCNPNDLAQLVTHHTTLEGVLR